MDILTWLLADTKLHFYTEYFPISRELSYNLKTSELHICEIFNNIIVFLMHKVVHGGNWKSLA